MVCGAQCGVLRCEHHETHCCGCCGSASPTVKPVSPSSSSLSPPVALHAVPEMCVMAFDVMTCELGKAHRSMASLASGSQMMQWSEVQCGVFVTYNKWSESESRWRLRGCLGTLQPMELLAGLRTYACHSAFRDRRFNPIRREELPLLQVGVSLLFDFETVRHGLHDWTIGVHGLLLDFKVRKQSFSATFLPDVIPEQGWDKETTLRQLVHKSGYEGQISAETLQRAVLTRYKSSKCSMDFSAYNQRTRSHEKQAARR
ncbi:Uncharacterized protein FVE85_0416 [Porphyridium purpureum]|uniref:AMMECR1 domain-containing protein n=1 Tax=Porphyridium purpureum TaxID=35688 RepID=A0A5J4Z1X7_PORPP|nr:Uncharacterized protein FVE85_0416 [Porphyridium purpureum]|eukprot:POR0508..scf208_2